MRTTITILLIAIATFLGALFGSAIAKATPIDDYIATNAGAICNLLDNEPTVDGVAAIGIILMGKGLTPQQAGEVMVRSVIGLCPRHIPELKAFAAKYSEGRMKV